MRPFRILSLVIAVIGLTGCGAHYVLDKYIDQSQIVSSNNPGAIKAYVGEYRFQDGPGAKIRVAEGEISLWNRKALKDAFGEVAFVDSKKNADITIETHKVELANTAGCGLKPCSRFYISVNNEPITLIVRHPNEFLSSVSERVFLNYMLAYTKLFTTVLRDVMTDGVKNNAKMPSEVMADMELKDGIFTNLSKVEKR